MRVLFIIFLALLCIHSLSAWDFCQKNGDGVMLYYNRIWEDDLCCEVAFCQGAFYDVRRLRIPEEVILKGDELKGIPDTVLTVVGIQENAFRFMNSVSGNYRYNERCLFVEVQFPPSLGYIGDYAFSGCDWLLRVIWPENTEWFFEIGEGAFKNTNLSEIRIPKTTEFIGPQAFMNSAITSVEFEEGNKSLKTIPEYCFYGCFFKKFPIPSFIKSIGDYAFAQCQFTDVPHLPYGLKEIGSYAFFNHKKWDKLEIPETVTDIGEYALCTEYKSDADGTKRRKLNLDKLYVNRKVPPYCYSTKTLGDETYDSESKTFTWTIDDVMLVVPLKSEKEYHTTFPWSRFNERNIRSRDLSGVSSATVPEAQPESIFSLDGKRLDFQQKGLNIIRYKDGTTRKVMR